MAPPCTPATPEERHRQISLSTVLLLDLQALRRLLQIQLAALCHLSFPVDGDALAVTKAAHPRFGPGVALCRCVCPPG